MFPASLLLFALGAITPPQDQPTFSRDIAPILRAKCLTCHQAGGVGPFDFTTYKKFSTHIRLIEVQALSKSMPPVHINSSVGPIAHVAPLTDQEIITIQRYIQSGQKPGAMLKSPLTPLHKPSPRNGISLRPKLAKIIRPDGPGYWINQIVETPNQTLHLTGFTIIPDSPKSLRNAQITHLTSQLPTEPEPAIFVDTQGSKYVATWAPGFPDPSLPPATTHTIPPKSKILITTFVQPAGKPEPAGFKLILQTTSKPGKYKTEVLSINAEPLDIPPDSTPTISIPANIPPQAELIAINPQARFYASTFTFLDNSKELFTVSRWNPQLLGNYQFSRPLKFNPSQNLQGIFQYANDERCQMNENRSPEVVTSGPRLQDERCRVHLLLKVPR
jgi:hypothetical protein